MTEEKLVNIIEFPEPTLGRCTINMKFNGEIDSIELKDLANFLEELKKQNIYDKLPRFSLFPQQFQKITFQPFQLETDFKKLQIGRDFLLFIIDKYTFWNLEIKHIIKVINIMNNFLDIPEIKEINMTYNDEFKIETSVFNLEKFFNITISLPWELNYEDFFLGIVPFEGHFMEGEGKMILRLKGNPKQEENNVFNLQSTFVVREFSIPFEEDQLYPYLMEIHDHVNSYFVKFLADEYKENLGLLSGDLEKNEKN